MGEIFLPNYLAGAEAWVAAHLRDERFSTHPTIKHELEMPHLRS